MDITAYNKDCFICGREAETRHHTLPKHLNPKNNIIIGLCDECHKKVHTFDVAGLNSYIAGVEKRLAEMTKVIRIMSKRTKNLYKTETLIVPVEKMGEKNVKKE
jgi:uncharacterized protein YlaI